MIGIMSSKETTLAMIIGRASLCRRFLRNAFGPLLASAMWAKKPAIRKNTAIRNMCST